MNVETTEVIFTGLNGNLLRIDGDIAMYWLAAEYYATTFFYPFGKPEISLGYVVATEKNKKNWQ
jgi:hypothetical protein